MNKKNKNKNKQNKVPNPIPPQNIEENVEVTEKIEERVPEIVPITEIVEVKNETEPDQPKKPKRNRGKKKTEDATGKTEDEKARSAPILEGLIIPDNELKIEQTEAAKEIYTEEKSIRDSEVITPSSNKKKNKNKKNNDKVLAQVKSDEKIDVAPAETTENKDKIADKQVSEKNIDTVLDVEVKLASNIPETNQSKKKNKNKKNKRKIDTEIIETTSDVIDQSIIKENIIADHCSDKPKDILEVKPKELVEQIKEKCGEPLSDANNVNVKGQKTTEKIKDKQVERKEQIGTNLTEVQEKNKLSGIEQMKLVQQDAETHKNPSKDLKEDNKNEQSKGKKKSKKKRTDSERSEETIDTNQPSEIKTKIEDPVKFSCDISKDSSKEEVFIDEEKPKLNTTQKGNKNPKDQLQEQKVEEKAQDIPQETKVIDEKSLQELSKVDRTQKDKSKSQKGKDKHQEGHKIVETPILKKDLFEEIPITHEETPIKTKIEKKTEKDKDETKSKEESIKSQIDVSQICMAEKLEDKISEQEKDIISKKEIDIPSCPIRKDKSKNSKQTIKIDPIKEQIKSKEIDKRETSIIKPEEICSTQRESKLEDDVIVSTIKDIFSISEECKLQIDKPLDKVDAATDPKEDMYKLKKKNKKDKKQVHMSDSIAPITEEAERFEITEEIQETKAEENIGKLSEKKEKPKLDLAHMDLTLPSTNVSIETAKIDDPDVEEFTPDSIEHPRSTSEQGIADPNNNIIIEELITESQNLSVPIQIPDTPFIKGVPNPEIISEINVRLDTPSSTQPNKPMETKINLDVNTTKSEFDKMISFAPKKQIPKRQEPKLTTETIVEKTDLKSKVMEVNHDMEELRLSIEKSLAELTALEKGEEMPELVSLTPEKSSELISKQASQMKIELPKTLDDQSPEPISLKALLGIGKSSEIENQDTRSLKMEILDTPIQINPDALVKESKKDKGKIKFEPALQSKLEDIKPLYLPDFSQITVPSQSLFEFGTQKGEKLKDTCHETPSCPIRKDKGKGKSKKKDKHEEQAATASTTHSVASTTQSSTSTTVAATTEKDNKEQKKDESTKEHKKEQKDDTDKLNEEKDRTKYDPIENFEDAMTSSVDDVNKSFELIADESKQGSNTERDREAIDKSLVTADESEREKEDDEERKIDGKENPLVTNPKNLLGHPDIPVPSNKMDYKKEKNRAPNSIKAKVRIKDAPEIEMKAKQHKQSQTELPKVVVTRPSNETNDYIYKYSFRKVFLPHGCHVCKKELRDVRVVCNYCNLLFYCSTKHKDEDWPQHQALCFAISTIVHLKGEKHIYADAKDVTGLNYRLLRMQMIVSCEKILKRRLVPWEQEILLYPRICADASCREWRHGNLKDCEGCGQISYCKENLDHLPKSHNRWCKSYSLYEKLVVYQQTKGRLEPRLPTKVISNADYKLPDKINELLANLYEEKIDMDELQYATLTQLATAPLTAAYCYQIYRNKINGIIANGFIKKSTFTIHVVGAELQFEADSLNKWEIFFLHLKPEVKELNIALIGPELNPSNLPLDLLSKIKLCENCRQNKRKVIFNFYDKVSYHEFANSNDFSIPDIVCAFNPSLNRLIGLKDSWQACINSILKLRSPLCITSYTPGELPKDLAKIKQYAAMDVEVVLEPSSNPYSSIRPDRNFITDDEQPLLFKNYFYMIVSGMF